MSPVLRVYVRTLRAPFQSLAPVIVNKLSHGKTLTLAEMNVHRGKAQRKVSIHERENFFENYSLLFVMEFIVIAI